MVDSLVGCATGWLAAVLAQTDVAPARPLDPAGRAKLLVALTSLAVLSLFFIALAWLALRMTRRYVDRSSKVAPQIGNTRYPVEDWAQRPLIEDNDAWED